MSEKANYDRCEWPWNTGLLTTRKEKEGEDGGKEGGNGKILNRKRCEPSSRGKEQMKPGRYGLQSERKKLGAPRRKKI